jgi:hypothetical protein
MEEVLDESEGLSVVDCCCFKKRNTEVLMNPNKVPKETYKRIGYNPPTGEDRSADDEGRRSGISNRMAMEYKR